jgi:hypothetical protein
VKFGDYLDGSRRFSCDAHHVPDRVGSSSGVAGNKRFSATVSCRTLAVVFGLNTLRVLIHAGKPDFFKPTLVGAFVGVALSVLAWFWFRSL